MTGAEFREARLRLGLKQWELAEIMGTGKNSISRIERGERNPTKMQAAFIRYILEHPPK